MPVNYREGAVILINKPLGWTSFDVVHKVRNLIKNLPTSNLQVPSSKPKVGHAGTLDPLATGVLIICTGKETKNADKYQADEKEYTGTFSIGATTPCYDLEKPIDQWFPTEHITDEKIYAVIQQFLGEIEQLPPVFSALKVEGKRSYDLARKGKEAILEPRKITISEFEITSIRREEKLIRADFRVVCSKGTYIRSLAYDFGRALNSGAYLENLCRTRSGNFRLENAVSMDDFKRNLTVTTA
jgi:tRNA pseudouridine55 synthase